jgi:hypothetical protein
MHGESIPGDRGGHRLRGSLSQGSQGDGRKPLAHAVTAILSVLISLAVAHFSGIAKGPQGQPGTTTVISKPVTETYGLCAFFGPDSSGRLRFQVSTPKKDKAGPWCPRGTYISVTPRG